MIRFAKLASAACVALLASATAMRADTITFTASDSNPQGGDGPVSASATITTGTNSLDISLTNLESNVGAAGQELSGIIVTLSNPITGYSQTSITSGEFTGNLIDIGTDGSTVTPDPGPIAQWGTSASGSTVCLEAAGDCSDGGKPTDLIIGPGPYNVNDSTFKRNPQIQGTGAFDLTVDGITSATTVDSVTFYFGTGPDFHLPGVRATTPEPSSLFLLGTGVLGSAFLLRRRMKAASVSS